MAFTGDEAEKFPIETAAKWIKNYAEQNPGRTKAHFFGNRILKEILGQEGCVGIRCYYSIDDEGKPQLIMVGADANENDLYQGIIAEISRPCPTFCSVANPLNGF